MMYKDDIQKEIDVLEREIRSYERRYRAAKIPYFQEVIHLKQRQVEAFKKLLPNARKKELPNEFVLQRLREPKIQSFF